MRQSRIFVELNDMAFRHLEKAEVVLTFKDVRMKDGTKVRVIPISKRMMKYKSEYYLNMSIDEA